jgi:hypothetical protein
VKAISGINKRINDGAQSVAKPPPKQPSIRTTTGGGVSIQGNLDIDAIVKRQLEREEQKLHEVDKEKGTASRD